MARPDVFVDTSGLYALVDRQDAHHTEARDAVASIVRSGRRLVVTEYVVSETVTLARVRSGAHVAVRVLDLVDESAGIRIEWIGALRFDAVKAYARRHADHDYSFVDCASFVVMRELKLSQALTTDGHFKEAGFQPLLRAPGR